MAPACHTPYGMAYNSPEASVKEIFPRRQRRF